MPPPYAEEVARQAVTSHPAIDNTGRDHLFRVVGCLDKAWLHRPFSARLWFPIADGKTSPASPSI